MKRFAFSIFSLAVGTMLLSPISYASNPNQPASKYERRYWAPMDDQAGMGEKGFEHKSLFQREQQPGMTAPQKENKSTLPAGKYERRYWEPTLD